MKHKSSSATHKSTSATSKSSSIKKSSSKHPSSKRPSVPSSFAKRVRSEVEKVTGGISDLFSSAPGDIVAAIKVDHNSLRNFLKVLKDTDAKMAERKNAYAQFSSLLKSHSESEEKIVYQTSYKLKGAELHLKVTEGYVEHQLAMDLMARISRAKNPESWSAHANVLAEIVEHHLDEEEKELLPRLKKAETNTIDHTMLVRYSALRKKTQRKVTQDNCGILRVLR